MAEQEKQKTKGGALILVRLGGDIVSIGYVGEKGAM
jgi:hypothetical protein